MIGLLLGLVLISWFFGRTKGLIGGFGGGLIGAFVLVGMARTAGNGELAALFTPGELASSALTLALLGAAFALIAPYATAVASLGWGAGALLAVVAVLPTNDAAYAISLVLHAMGAACVACLARRCTATGAAKQPPPRIPLG